MSNKPDLLVSVIMPTYNSSKFVAESINSILNQTYLNFELLITDDCSSDETVSILKNFEKRYLNIKVFSLAINSGAGVARNNSIKEAKGRFIAFCDSDDIWLPNKLEIQVNFMVSNNLSFTYSNYKIYEFDNYKSKVKPPLMLKYDNLLNKNYIGCLTVMYDESVTGKMYMPLLRNRQDWGFWLLIIKRTGVAIGINQELAIYNIRNSSISRNKFNLIRYHFKIYRDLLGLGFIHSIYRLIINILFELRFKILNR